MRTFFFKSVVQAALIVFLGVMLAFLLNAIRTEPLPLVVVPSERGISVADAFALYQQGGAIFIDARDSWSFEEMGHLPGALNIQPNDVHARAEELLALSKSGKMLITYCDGARCFLGEKTAHKIIALGIAADVRVLHNGWTLWQRSSLPMEKWRERQ